MNKKVIGKNYAEWRPTLRAAPVVWSQTFPIAIMYLIRYPFRMIHHDLMEKVLMIFGSKVFSMPLLFPISEVGWETPRKEDEIAGSSVETTAAAAHTNQDWSRIRWCTYLPEEKIAHKLSWKCLPSPSRWGNEPWIRDTFVWFLTRWTSSSCIFALVNRAGNVGELPVPPARDLQVNRKNTKINYLERLLFASLT